MMGCLIGAECSVIFPFNLMDGAKRETNVEKINGDSVSLVHSVAPRINVTDIHTLDAGDSRTTTHRMQFVHHTLHNY